MKTQSCIFLLLVSIKLLASIWQGEYRIESQAEANQFIEHCNCTTIDGDLIIYGGDIVQVDSLYRLEEVKGNIEIYNNANLKSLKGLNNVTYIKRNLEIKYNGSFAKQSYFKNLKNVDGGIIIKYNYLSHIDGFNSLVHINNDITLDLNEKLKEINGFEKLEYCRDFIFTRNYALESINAFSHLKKTNSILIEKNDSLAKIGGFNRLDTIVEFIEIKENPLLQTIEAFDQLQHIEGDLQIILSDQIKEDSHFPNLASINGMLSGNLTNFNQLEWAGIIQFYSDIIGDTLSGFSSLCNAGTINIAHNQRLTHINAFNNLEKADFIRIYSNSKLSALDNFNKLKVSNIEIISNDILGSIHGFQMLEKADILLLGGSSSLKHINAFNTLQKADSILRISYNSFLTDIDGFENLTTVGRLEITLNNNLKDITAFDNLRFAKSVIIADNTNFSEFEGFNNLKRVNEYLSIINNNNLLSIKGFDELDWVSVLGIRNRNLRNLAAFKSLEVVDELNINDNIQLRSIESFPDLKFINSKLKLIGNLQLNECCIINCWLHNQILEESTSIEIEKNAGNCNSIDIISKNCNEENCEEKDTNTLFNLYIHNNPVQYGSLLFEFVSKKNQTIDYKILNMNHQHVSRGSIVAYDGINKKAISLFNFLSDGYYFLILQDEETLLSQKFLKLY